MNSITLSSGKSFNYLDIESNELSIEDIAKALSKLCRFSGHCNEFYSVAQHSVLVSQIVDRKLAKEALLHDASEAVLADLPSPLKALLPDYKALEFQVSRFIYTQFGLMETLHPLIHKADLIALATEKYYLLPNADDQVWDCIQGVERLNFDFETLDPISAEFSFLDRARQLGL